MKNNNFKGFLIPDQYLDKIQGKSNSNDTYVLCCPKCGGTNLIATRNVGLITC